MNIFLFIIEIILIIITIYMAWINQTQYAIIALMLAIYLRLLNEENFP